jgi:hypothetical protein
VAAASGRRGPASTAAATVTAATVEAEAAATDAAALPQEPPLTVLVTETDVTGGGV